MSQQKGEEVYRRMEQWVDIRQRVLRDGVSKRQILRGTRIHWTTRKKILEHPSPPGYQRKKRPDKPKIDPCRERIRQILDQDKHIDKKQRHTAKRIWERLRESKRRLQRRGCQPPEAGQADPEESGSDDASKK